MRQHHLTICVTHDVIRIRLNRRNLNKDIRFKSDKKRRYCEHPTFSDRRFCSIFHTLHSKLIEHSNKFFFNIIEWYTMVPAIVTTNVPPLQVLM